MSKSSDKPGKVNIVMFSEAKIALMKEVRDNWPELGVELVNQESKEWSDQLGTIAAYCNVLVDGMYTGDELETLTDKLFWKLKGKKVGLITAPIGVPIAEFHKPKVSIVTDPSDTKH
jgi:hypothetical protein